MTQCDVINIVSISYHQSDHVGRWSTSFVMTGQLNCNSGVTHCSLYKVQFDRQPISSINLDFKVVATKSHWPVAMRTQE